MSKKQKVIIVDKCKKMLKVNKFLREKMAYIVGTINFFESKSFFVVVRVEKPVTYYVPLERKPDWNDQQIYGSYWKNISEIEQE